MYLKDQTECFVASIIWFLKKIASCPVKLDTPHNFWPLYNYNSQPKKWLRQAMHCPSYSALVSRSLELNSTNHTSLNAIRELSMRMRS